MYTWLEELSQGVYSEIDGPYLNKGLEEDMSSDLQDDLKQLSVDFADEHRDLIHTDPDAYEFEANKTLADLLGHSDTSAEDFQDARREFDQLVDSAVGELDLDSDFVMPDTDSEDDYFDDADFDGDDEMMEGWGGESPTEQTLKRDQAFAKFLHDKGVSLLAFLEYSSQDQAELRDEFVEHEPEWFTGQDQTDFEENAFVAKAAAAKKAGKDKFKLGDKEFPVTIDQDAADNIAKESIDRLRKLSGLS
jgi:hypothetical protein